jgi:hypothetical protein
VHPRGIDGTGCPGWACHDHRSLRALTQWGGRKNRRVQPLWATAWDNEQVPFTLRCPNDIILNTAF